MRLVLAQLSVLALSLAQLAAGHAVHDGAAAGSRVASFEPATHLRRFVGARPAHAPLMVENEAKPLAVADAEQIARSFFDAASGFEWVVKNAYTTKHNGVSHVYLRQTYNGREIVNADANINIDRFGNVLSAAENGMTVEAADKYAASFVGKPALPEFEMSPADALKIFARFLKMPEPEVALKSSITGPSVLVAPEFSLEDVPFKEAYIQIDGELRPVWSMVVRQENAWYDVTVDAISSQVHSAIDWVADYDAFYSVFKEPNLDHRYGERSLVFDGLIRSSSPKGWHNLYEHADGHKYITTIGNNAIAQEHTKEVAGGFMNYYRPIANTTTPLEEMLPFDMRYPIDWTKGPETYRDASVLNMFYWNNFLHDLYYLYGFDEESGNFQESNFEKGGLGGDAVQANAQDLAGTNNANFATPPDGKRPTMRMYIYTKSTPYRDGALDSGIVIHEYSHGLSTRLTGGPANSGCLSTGQPGGMGEGWGDCIGAFLEWKKGDDPSRILYHAAYASNAPAGNRRYGYTTNTTANPHTFASLNLAGNDEVHAAGNIWCSILWEPYVDMVQTHGFGDWHDTRKRAGNHKMLQNVIDGMKLQPCRPSFTDARDAIILADDANYEGEHRCLLWRGFAKRGLGVSAVVNKDLTVTEAFDIPAECQL